MAAGRSREERWNYPRPRDPRGREPREPSWRTMPADHPGRRVALSQDLVGQSRRCGRAIEPRNEDEQWKTSIERVYDEPQRRRQLRRRRTHRRAALYAGVEDGEAALRFCVVQAAAASDRCEQEDGGCIP